MLSHGPFFFVEVPSRTHVDVVDIIYFYGFWVPVYFPKNCFSNRNLLGIFSIVYFFIFLTILVPMHFFWRVPRWEVNCTIKIYFIQSSYKMPLVPLIFSSSHIYSMLFFCNPWSVNCIALLCPLVRVVISRWFPYVGHYWLCHLFLPSSV
jgi:hypothetical protein